MQVHCSVSTLTRRRRARGRRRPGRGSARLCADPPGWKGLLYGVIKFPLGIMNFTIVVTLWAVAFGGTTFPLWGWAVPSNFGDNHPIHGWLKAGYIAANFVVGVAR